MSTTRGLTLHNDLLDLAEAVPPLPSTVTRLASAIANAQCEIEEITTIVREDPIVVAALLRESNSAASAPVSEIVTTEAAIMRLGTARVLAVATDSGLPEQTREGLTSYQMEAGELWEHSIRVSYVAEAIYKANRALAGPEVVTAALLHDLGQMLLDKVLDPHHFGEAMACHTEITAAERELVEVDHAELGALLLELWGIPWSISDAVRHHHQPEFGESAMPYIVSAADRFVHEIFDARLASPEDNHEHLLRSLAFLGLDYHGVLDGAHKLLTDYGHTFGDD
ncbi:MAG: HDOD domain-containing protein [Actinomycetia bacterium]|nr:HDOD domain-containing protein [Actinomycetes bacterium]MCP4221999.1 HDOD domain-containing protein [Actinomycetes bacterium]MCP5035321.1 HDOD domain-containing protein [Actinomycetes bacterium]